MLEMACRYRWSLPIAGLHKITRTRNCQLEDAFHRSNMRNDDSNTLAVHQFRNPARSTPTWRSRLYNVSLAVVNVPSPRDALRTCLWREMPCD
jgi:hypothetical protein